MMVLNNLVAVFMVVRWLLLIINEGRSWSVVHFAGFVVLFVGLFELLIIVFFE
jgi:hypothetical protein